METENNHPDHPASSEQQQPEESSSKPSSQPSADDKPKPKTATTATTTTETKANSSNKKKVMVVSRPTFSLSRLSQSQSQQPQHQQSSQIKAGAKRPRTTKTAPASSSTTTTKKKKRTATKKSSKPPIPSFRQQNAPVKEEPKPLSELKQLEKAYLESLGLHSDSDENDETTTKKPVSVPPPPRRRHHRAGGGPPIPNFTIDIPDSSSDEDEDDDELKRMLQGPPTFSSSSKKPKMDMKQEEEEEAFVPNEIKALKPKVARKSVVTATKKRNKQPSSCTTSHEHVDQVVKETPSTPPQPSSQPQDVASSGPYSHSHSSPPEDDGADPGLFLMDDNDNDNDFNVFSVGTPGGCSSSISVPASYPSIHRPTAATTKKEPQVPPPEPSSVVHQSSQDKENENEDANQKRSTSSTTSSNCSSNSKKKTKSNDDDHDDAALQRLIDQLYLQADKTTVTVQSFLETLRDALGTGKKLKKAVKKLARTRLKDLVNGRVTPMVVEVVETTTTTTTTTATAKSASAVPKDTTTKASSKATGSKPPSSTKTQKSVSKGDQEVAVKKKMTTSHHANSAHVDNGKENEDPAAKKMPSKPSAPSTTKNQAKGKGLVGTKESSTENISEKRTDDSAKDASDDPAKAQPKRKPPTTTIQRQPKASKAAPDSNAEQANKTSTTKASSKAKAESSSTETKQEKPASTQAKRGRPAKRKATEETKATTETKTVAAKKPAPAPRKRARKGTCALCTTCPCQNASAHQDGTVLDLKTMSKSDIAIEKALIRRIQKLEKSAESMETQVDVVKRKLKKHRREMWKKRDQLSTDKALAISNAASQSRFLPDAVELDALNRDSSTLEWEAVDRAQHRMFHDFKPSVPAKTKQTKLTAMLGLVVPETEIEEEGKEPTAPEPQATAPAKNDTDGSIQDQMLEQQTMQIQMVHEDVPVGEYVKSPTSSAKVPVSRVSHHDQEGALNKNQQLLRGPSAWGALTTIDEEEDQEPIISFGMTQLLNGEVKEPKKPFATSWDELFAAEEEPDTEQMDALLNVFDSHGIPSTQVLATQPNDDDSEEEEREDAPIRLSMLSQTRQSKATELQEDVVQDESLHNAVKTACPEWKENILFALHQDHKGSVHEALDNVRRAKQRMLETKRKILEAWERQNLALGVFENALNTSLVRLDEKTQKDETHLSASKPSHFHQLHQDEDVVKSPLSSQSSQISVDGKENVGIEEHQHQLDVFEHDDSDGY